MMESHKTEEVVEKRVARQVIRRRKQEVPAELPSAVRVEVSETKPEPINPTVAEVQVQPIENKVAESTATTPPPVKVVPDLPTSDAEPSAFKRSRVLGQIQLKKQGEKPVEPQALVPEVDTAQVSTLSSEAVEKRLSVAAEKAKHFEEEQKELRKNLTFKDRLQGTLSLDKLHAGRPVAATKPPPGTAPRNLGPLPGGAEDTPEEVAKKEKIAKHRKVKNIGGDLDIDGGGKITTLTHLVRTNVLDRVFRPDSRLGQKTKRKVIARKKTKGTQITLKSAAKRFVSVDSTLTVGSLAQQLGVKASEVIKKLMNLGVMATINQNLDLDTVTLIAQDYQYTVKDTSFKEEAILSSTDDEGAEQVDADQEPRPPIVTIMGHVDHGKTSLLDAIRQTSVTEQEAGGITQHIGAYTVDLPQGKITFLDTPGHEAFTTMRARGANVTDIVVLVVAADDGLMPQTEESISHAKAAGVPMIVAINKMDKPEAKPDVVLRQLSEKGVLVEEWGGDVQTIKVSALKKTGIKELLESILLQAEVLELKANPKKPASGTVLEARLDKGRGPVATLLVQDGVLKTGDAVVVGESVGKIRAMSNWKGERIETAVPSTAVEVLGLETIPQASDSFHVVASEQDARKIAENRQMLRLQAQSQAAKPVTLEDMFSHLKEGQVKEFNFIVKTDVQGSLEAIEQSILKLGTEEVKARIILSGVGAIRDSDVNLAATSKAVIIGFHVRPETTAIHLAKEKGVEIKLYKIIYDLVDEVKLALSGMLAPTLKENYLGRAEVREVFQVSKVGLIAGSMVVDGLIQRNAKLRLLRDNVVIHEGEIASLKRFKDDAKDVKQGFECGIGISGYQDIKPGDVIEAYVIEEIRRSL